MIGFKLTPDQESRLVVWEKEQDAKVAELQKNNPMIPQYLKTEAYYGTIDGGYTFSFTPTGLGVAVRVKNAVTGEEIDLSDYDLW
ncbi:MAG: hypothetical protein WC824_06595 [Bacteroidota bacterium]|jgi:hypothetical protein